ncbi:unnamed protein product, partial [Trichogramma brassicae]
RTLHVEQMRSSKVWAPATRCCLHETTLYTGGLFLYYAHHFFKQIQPHHPHWRLQPQPASLKQAQNYKVFSGMSKIRLCASCLLIQLITRLDQTHLARPFLLNCYNDVAPLRMYTVSARGRPWVSSEIRELMTQRDRAYRRAWDSESVDFQERTGNKWSGSFKHVGGQVIWSDGLGPGACDDPQSLRTSGHAQVKYSTHLYPAKLTPKCSDGSLITWSNSEINWPLTKSGGSERNQIRNSHTHNHTWGTRELRRRTRAGAERGVIYQLDTHANSRTRSETARVDHLVAGVRQNAALLGSRLSAADVNGTGRIGGVVARYGEAWCAARIASTHTRSSPPPDAPDTHKISARVLLASSLQVGAGLAGTGRTDVNTAMFTSAHHSGISRPASPLLRCRCVVAPHGADYLKNTARVFVIILELYISLLIAGTTTFAEGTTSHIKTRQQA